MHTTAHDAALRLIDRGVTLKSWMYLALTEKLVRGNGCTLAIVTPDALFDDAVEIVDAQSASGTAAELLEENRGRYLGEQVVVWMLGLAACNCDDHRHAGTTMPMLTVFVVDRDHIDIASVTSTNRIVDQNMLANGDDLVGPLFGLVNGDPTPLPPHLEDSNPAG